MTTEKRIKKIECELDLLKEELLERKPERFSAKDIVRAFFGALLIGVTFIFSSRLFDVAKQIQPDHFIAVVVSTIIILIAEIYFIGWSRIKKEREKGRNVFEFTLKRLAVFYVVALLVASFYSYILGYNKVLSETEFIKLIFLTAMPCAIGAAIADLLKKY